MSYFSAFPLIQDYQIGDQLITSVDITKIVTIDQRTKDNPNNYLSYTIQNETPEILADRMYDSADDSWVILLFNDIFDVDDQWPISYNDFEQYVISKYGESLYDIKFYRSLQTNAIVDSTHPTYDLLPVTNYEYEIELNDSKRSIKVPVPQVAVEIKRTQRKALKR